MNINVRAGFVITMLAFLLLAGSAGAAPFAYITGENVSVIDIATNTVAAVVDTGSVSWGVAVNPAGTRVYVTNPYDNAVLVIDTATNTVTATVNVGISPYGVAVNPAGTRVYVANSNSDTVSVIDAATNTVSATVTVGSYPYGVAVNPAGTRVYVTNNMEKTVDVIDTATNKVTATVNVGSLPYGVAVNPAGTLVYVADGGGNTVHVIDTATNMINTTIIVGIHPWGIAVNQAGTRVYVANHNSNNVSVIDTATNTVVSMVNVGYTPVGVAVNPAGTRVYVANSDSHDVSVIDTAANTVTATVNVEGIALAFGRFIGPETMATPNAVGYTATVLCGQNTVIQASDGAFGSILRGQSKTISPSVVLNNTGCNPAKVEARFADSIGGIFGLVSGPDILAAHNFQLGPTGSIVALNDDGSDVQVATAPVGHTLLDARLSVPATQQPGAYAGSVILTFSNA